MQTPHESFKIIMYIAKECQRVRLGLNFSAINKSIQGILKLTLIWHLNFPCPFYTWFNIMFVCVYGVIKQKQYQLLIFILFKINVLIQLKFFNYVNRGVHTQEVCRNIGNSGQRWKPIHERNQHNVKTKVDCC